MTQEVIEAIKSYSLIWAKEILTTDEACLFLGIEKSYMYEMVRKKRIPYYKSKGGKLTYFKKKDLEEWMLGVPVRSEEQTEALASAM